MGAHATPLIIVPLLLLVSTITHRSPSYLISPCFSLTLASFTQKLLFAVLPMVFFFFCSYRCAQCAAVSRSAAARRRSVRAQGSARVDADGVE